MNEAHLKFETPKSEIETTLAAGSSIFKVLLLREEKRAAALNVLLL